MVSKELELEEEIRCLRFALAENLKTAIRLENENQILREQLNQEKINRKTELIRQENLERSRYPGLYESIEEKQ